MGIGIAVELNAVATSVLLAVVGKKADHVAVKSSIKAGSAYPSTRHLCRLGGWSLPFATSQLRHRFGP